MATARRCRCATSRCLFGDPRFYQAVGNTATVRRGRAVVSCLSASCLAWIVSRTDMPGRRWFEMLNLVPFFLSPYVGAVSWIYLAAPNSGCSRPARAARHSLEFTNIYSVGGVIFVLSLFYTPYVYLSSSRRCARWTRRSRRRARARGIVLVHAAPHHGPAADACVAVGRAVVFVTSAACSTCRSRWPRRRASARCRPRSTRWCNTRPTSAEPRRSASSCWHHGVAHAVAATLLGRRRFDTVSGKGYRPRPCGCAAGRIGRLRSRCVYIGGGVVLPIIGAADGVVLAHLDRKTPRGYLTLRNYD